MGKLRNMAALAGSPRLGMMLRRAREAGLETLLCYRRLALLTAAAEHARDLTGDVIEFGTYRGGSAGVLAQVLNGSGKVLHVCDSFEGLPAPSAQDNFHQRGDFQDTSEAVVRRGLARFDTPVRVHAGYFENTLPALADAPLALAHIDVDLYSSVGECLEFAYPRMAPGGIILLDDYGARTCEGAKTATDEFLQGRPEPVVRLTGAQHGIWVGRGKDDLFNYLRRRAGWSSALPGIGARIYQR
jgi:O-methyltransferase